MIETTEDLFLGGQLIVRQPKNGYRAGADPVFLAASVPASAGQSVLELGCGVGVAILCLCRRVSGLEVAGVEIQPDLADMARHNFSSNDLPADIATADLAEMPDALKARTFDHVIANPPFFDRGAGHRADAPGREGGRGEGTPLSKWVDTGVRRLKPGGQLTVIQRAERLPELLSTCDTRVGDVRVQPLAARYGRAPELVIVSARKGAKGIFVLEAPLILHDGAQHDIDRDSASLLAKSILRGGTGLEDAKFMHM